MRDSISQNGDGMTLHMLADRIRKVEADRQKYVDEAIAMGTPKIVAESLSREKYYDELLEAAEDIADFFVDKEDDLK